MQSEVTIVIDHTRTS